MPPNTRQQWFDIVGQSGLLDESVLERWAQRCKHERKAATVAKLMVDEGLMSNWQSDLLLRGKFKGFFIDHYCLWDLLERDDRRGIEVYRVIDPATGARVVMELVPPERAMTKANGLFYIVHADGQK